jgi:hypothetical protein
MSIENDAMFYALVGEWPHDYAREGWSMRRIQQTLARRGSFNMSQADDVAAYLELAGYPMHPAVPAAQLSEALNNLIGLAIGPASRGRMDDIRQAVYLVADLWQTYQAGAT